MCRLFGKSMNEWMNALTLRGKIEAFLYFPSAKDRQGRLWLKKYRWNPFQNLV